MPILTLIAEQATAKVGAGGEQMLLFTGGPANCVKQARKVWAGRRLPTIVLFVRLGLSSIKVPILT